MGVTKTTLQKHRLALVLAIIIAIAVAVGSLALAQLARINNNIFDAGAQGVEETYAEVGRVFTELSTARWNYLHLIGDYLRDTHAADSETRAMIESKRAEYGFTEFYFLDASGRYVTLDGERGHLDLGQKLLALTDDEWDVLIDGSLPRHDSMLFYVVTVPAGSYAGEDYVAVAMGYNKQDMTSMLGASAYSGATSTYLTYTNGRVAMSMEGAELDLRNVFDRLRRLAVPAETQKAIMADFRDYRAGTHEVIIDGRSYYLSYQPLESADMMLVSFTATDVANDAIVTIQQTTVRLVVGILIITGLLFFGGLLYWSRRNIKEKNTQLREREIIFSLIAKSADELYILYNMADYQVRYVSPNIERLIGVTADELYTSIYRLKDLFASEEEWERCNVVRALAPGEIRRQEAVLANLATKERSLFAIELYRLEGEHTDDVVITMADRRREESVRREIETAMALAEKANQSKSAFLSSMSHDIRTPMNAIIGFTTLLSKYADNSARVLEYAGKISASSRHLLSLINDVLDMSKIEAGKMTLSLEPLDVAELVGELEAMVRSQASAKEQTLTVTTELASTAPVMSDRLRLSQILLNILSNAIKYTPAGGAIAMRVASSIADNPSYAIYTFTVSDNGVGMTKEFLANIFAPFSRAESTAKLQGTGLGMSITESMVKLMGGTITVDSELGVGSTFEVVLKLQLAEEEAHVHIADYEEDYSIEGLRILAAEDNELNAEILAELLEDEGAACDIVDNGAMAVEKFMTAEPGTYDAILMDVQMPVMNGYEATRKIRASTHDEATTIPIIAMTANAFIEDVQEAIQSGMNEHLAKPIYINGLKAKLRMVLQDK